MRGIRRTAAAALAILALSPGTALAHAEKGMAAGFTSGFRHPLSGWDHILAMVAVGLVYWRRRARRQVRRLAQRAPSLPPSSAGAPPP